MRLLSSAALLGLLLLLAGECWGQTNNSTQGFYYQSVCPTFVNGSANCNSRVLLYNGAVFHPTRKTPRALQPLVLPANGGLNAAQIKSAYGIPYAGVPAGITVGIVMFCDHPAAETDLALYRADNGLPACTTANGCFRKLNQVGAAAPIGAGCTAAQATSAAGEISLDIQMVSATCPSCNILLVLADSPVLGNLYTAIGTAVALGARVVSMSWGTPEQAVQPAVFLTAGVGFFASSGDWGFNQPSPPPPLPAPLNTGVESPASFPNVIAVGGTALTAAAGTTRGWSESAWIDAGAGCSAFTANPSPGVNTGCGALRAVADVSAVAQNVNVVLNGLYVVMAGTSVSSPIMASIFALTGNAGVPANWPYNVGRPHFLDITTGAINVPNPTYPVPLNQFGPVPGACGTNLCNAVVGYDGPTGVGVWFPVAPTCATFTCPAGATALPTTTVCTSLAGCTQAECCIAGCVATTAPLGYVGNCAAGQLCNGVTCAAGYAGVAAAICVNPGGAFSYLGCTLAAAGCATTGAPLGYRGDCAAGLVCVGVTCAPGFVGTPVATCVVPPGPYSYAGCMPVMTTVRTEGSDHPELFALFALILIPFLCIGLILACRPRPVACPCPGMMAYP